MPKRHDFTPDVGDDTTVKSRSVAYPNNHIHGSRLHGK